MTLWSARVGTHLDPAVWSFLQADDAELLPYDLEATLLHAGRLHAAGILDDGELADVTAKLATIEPPEPTDEDVHSAIERQLGEVGRVKEMNRLLKEIDLKSKGPRPISGDHLSKQTDNSRNV